MKRGRKSNHISPTMEPQAAAPAFAGELRNVAPSRIFPNPDQPRTEFDRDELNALADSIRTHGILQPPIAEELPDGSYQLIAGERRWRAAKIAGLAAMPILVRPYRNGSAGEVRRIEALVENVQRADMNPVEEAKAYQELMEHGMTMGEIARNLGISQTRVRGRLDILRLDEPVQGLIASGKLSKDARIVEALLTIDDPTARFKTAQSCAERNLTIKATIEAVNRVRGALAADKISKDEVPGIRLAARRAGELNRPVWDAFASVGKLPPWLLVELAARTTCERCSLRDVASADTCRSCPLVEVLVIMLGKTQSGETRIGKQL